MGTATKQTEVYNSIVRYIEEHGYPPTISEICQDVGLKSKSSVFYHVQNMLALGLLETDADNLARAIRVPGYKFVKEADGETE